MPDNQDNSPNPQNENPGNVRVGVYTCYCGGNISHVVNCERVAKTLSKLPDVVVSRTDLSFCSDAGQSIIENDIRELGINRVVSGRCVICMKIPQYGNAAVYHSFPHVAFGEDSWVHYKIMRGATRKS
jgi:heterodisulfide reductase subunit A